MSELSKKRKKKWETIISRLCKSMACLSCAHWVDRIWILCLQKGRGDLGEGESWAAAMLTDLGAVLREGSCAGWDSTWER